MTQYNGSWKKPYCRFALCYAPVGAFIVVCVQYVVSHWSDFEFLASVTLPELIVAGLLIAFMYIMAAFQLKVFVTHFGITLSSGEVTWITGAMLLGNFVMPMRLGTAGLALYLRKVHTLDWHAFATIFGGTALLAALVNSGLAFPGVVLLATLYGFANAPLAACCTGLLCVLIRLTLSPPALKVRKAGLLSALSQVITAWLVLSSNRRLLGIQILISVATAVAAVGGFEMIYLALGLRYPIAAVLVSSSLGNVVNIIPLTPGSLGIFDAIVIEIPQMFGMDPARSVAGALAFRALSFFWALVLGIPGTIFFAKAVLAPKGSSG